ncbi:hypothetical protein D3C81_1196860 [compost metagenome]
MDHLDKFGWVRVQIDHVPRFFCRLGAGVHRYRHVSLRQRRGVVGAVAGHRHQTAFSLVLADQRQLGFRRRFRQEVIHSGFGGNGGSGQWVITGDHHRFDAHFAQFDKAFFDTAFDDILQRHHPQHPWPFCHHQRRTAGACHAGHQVVYRLREVTLIGLHVTANGIHCAFTDHAILHVDAAHARLGREGHEGSVQRLQVTFAQVKALFGQYDNAAAFRRFIRQ